MPGKHNWYDWKTFEESAALALWTDAYMSEVEELVAEDRSSEAREAYHELSPGPGGNWETVIPEPVPTAAKKQAKEFTKLLRDKISDEDLQEVADKLDATKAGWYAMFQAIGHGIGWGDYGIKAHPNIHTEASGDVYNAAYTAVKRALKDAGIKFKRLARYAAR